MRDQFVVDCGKTSPETVIIDQCISSMVTSLLSLHPR